MEKITSSVCSPFYYLHSYREFLQIYTVLLGNTKNAVTGAFLMNVMLLVATNTLGFGIKQLQLGDSLGKGVFAECHKAVGIILASDSEYKYSSTTSSSWITGLLICSSKVICALKYFSCQMRQEYSKIARICNGCV